MKSLFVDHITPKLVWTSSRCRRSRRTRRGSEAVEPDAKQQVFATDCTRKSSLTRWQSTASQTSCGATIFTCTCQFGFHSLNSCYRCNLSSVVLQLMVLGISDVASFDFIDKPSTVQFKDAIDQLVWLGAIESNKKTVNTNYDHGSLTHPNLLN